MKITSRMLKIGIIVLIIGIVTITFISAQEGSRFNIELDGSGECNRCHGSSHIGHVRFSVVVNTPSVILNGTPTIVSASITNSQFPLSGSSLAIAENPDYIISSTVPLVNSLGKLARGMTATAKWEIIPKVTTNKSISINIHFEGTARDHKTFTYTKDIATDVFVSVTPISILFVTSTPLSDTTFFLGSENTTGTLTVSNIGTLEMDNVVIKATGNLLVDGTTEIIILQLGSLETKNYSLSIDTSKVGSGIIEVVYQGAHVQSSVISIKVQEPPPIPIPQLLGRIFGYATYILLFASVVTGVGRYHLNRRFSGRKIRILHADLSNLSFTMVTIHAVVLTIPDSSWANSYQWFELLPEGIPNDIIGAGLELGRISLVIMYVSLLSGYYFSKLIKKFGRKMGISIHMLSYIALAGGVIHAILIGGTANIPVVATILIISLLSIIWIKWDVNKKRKAKRSQRVSRRTRPVKPVTSTKAVKTTPKLEVKKTEPKEIKEPEVPVIKVDTSSSGLQMVLDVRSSSSKGMGVVCWKCTTLNDDDAIYCKRCASRLEGIPCFNCSTRNDEDAVFCKSCGNKLDVIVDSQQVASTKQGKNEAINKTKKKTTKKTTKKPVAKTAKKPAKKKVVKKKSASKKEDQK